MPTSARSRWSHEGWESCARSCLCDCRGVQDGLVQLQQLVRWQPPKPAESWPFAATRSPARGMQSPSPGSAGSSSRSWCCSSQWFGASAAAGRLQHQPGEPVEIKRCRQTQLTSGQWHRRHRLHTQQCAVACSLAFTLCPRHHMDELQQPSLEEAKLGGEQPCLEGAKPG